MTASDDLRLRDILAAAEAIERYTGAADLEDAMVFDAVRRRLVEIGEAVKALSEESRTREPGIRWRAVAGMRDHLAHRYFDTTHTIVGNTVRNDLPPLVDAVRRLLAAPPAGGR